MKKLFILLFALTITIPTFAGLKSKDIVGKWKYEMTISNSEIDGSFNFSEKTGKLKGDAIQSDGRIFPLSKIKVNKKNNTLSFEIPRENDVAIEFVLNIKENKFKGQGWVNDADFEISGIKINTKS